MLPEDIKQFIAAETELYNVAAAALETDVSSKRRAHTRRLLERAEVYVDYIADFEGTDNSVLIARQILHFATLDPRILLEVPETSIDPGDRLSRRLAIRRVHYPETAEELERAATENMATLG